MVRKPSTYNWPMRLLSLHAQQFLYYIQQTLLPSLVPRPLPQKAERGSGVLSDISCHMGRGLKHKECHYCILHPDSSFLITSNAARYSIQKLDKATKVLEKAENELRDKCFLVVIPLKIRSLTSCTYNYVFCKLIRALRSESYTAPCDKKSCSEHQTLFLAHAGRGWA